MKEDLLNGMSAITDYPCKKGWLYYLLLFVAIGSSLFTTVIMIAIYIMDDDKRTIELNSVTFHSN
jgi:hypothetical protein